MKKSDVIRYFNSAQEVADTLKVSRSVVYMWPEELPFSVIGRVSELAPQVHEWVRQDERARAQEQEEAQA